MSAFRTATGDDRPAEVKVFDYIYGVLHSPAYRETYAEFLKIDFPRIPYPRDPETFAHISEKGETLRRLHLMEAAAIGDTPYPFVGEGDDVVAAGYPKFEPNPPLPFKGGDQGVGARVRAPENSSSEPDKGADEAIEASPLQPTPNPSLEREGRVYINKTQSFDAVPPLAWTFPIGGYQPAQKWLKDRRGRTLSWEDIGHYQKIIKILVETDRIMREIDSPLSGGADA